MKIVENLSTFMLFPIHAIKFFRKSTSSHLALRWASGV